MTRLGTQNQMTLSIKYVLHTLLPGRGHKIKEDRK